MVLSAQATDKGVNKATEPLFKIADTPQKMVALGEAGLTQYIKTIGLLSRQGQNVIALSKLLIERHGGVVPHTREELEALPGAGRNDRQCRAQRRLRPEDHRGRHPYLSASATAQASRPGKNVLEVELKLEKKVPDKYKLHAHHWLILHGRYTCIARKPLCPTCVVRDLCRTRTRPKKARVVRKPAAAGRRGRAAR
ncbi:MAG: endonuclease III [Rhizomicrobium sp.]